MKKRITASQQKFLKFLHLTSSGVWLSCVIVLALLPVIATRNTTGGGIYMYTLAYHFIDMFILTPASLLTLVTGLVYSLFTQWGFFRHGWIVYKWIVTLFIVITGTVYLGPMVTDLLEIATAKQGEALQDRQYVQSTTIGLWAAILNSTLLIGAVFVSVYKPWKNLKKAGRARE